MRSLCPQARSAQACNLVVSGHAKNIFIQPYKKTLKHYKTVWSGKQVFHRSITSLCGSACAVDQCTERANQLIVSDLVSYMTVIVLVDRHALETRTLESAGHCDLILMFKRKWSQLEGVRSTPEVGRLLEQPQPMFLSQSLLLEPMAGPRSRCADICDYGSLLCF